VSVAAASEEENRIVGRALTHSLVIILFFLSGASSLIYEILWMRMFTQVFGSTTTATATVLSAFMAGLALGSYLIGSYADRHPQNALKLYAYLEGMIGVFGLSMPFLIKALYYVYGWIFTNFGNDYYILGASRFFLSLLLILIPTTFMGATLPVLSKHFVFSHRTLCRWVGVLYGVNTFGAVMGTFISGFFLIEWLGVTWTTRTAALMNFVIAALAIMLAGFGRKDLDANAPLPAGEPADSGEVGDVTGEGVRKLLLAVCFGAGFMSLAFEVIWVRMLVFVLDSTVYAFCTMLTSFLFGIALGGFLISALYSRIKSELRWLAALETLIGISGFATIVLLARIPGIDAVLRKALGYVSEGGWWTTTALKFFEAFAIMLIPTVLMGMAFPLICKIYTRSIKQLGGSIGAVYAVNTFGAVLGSLLGGFVMIPLLGIIKSISMLSILGIFLGGVLFFTAPARISRWFYGAVALAAVACAVFTWTSDDLLSSVYSIPEPGSRLAYYHEGRSGTITIHIYPGEERLISVNATNVAGTQFSLRTTQKLQAHIPMLVHGHARKVLQIGFGSGESCHVLSTYPVEHIDLVEIDADVLQASDEFFGDLNQGIVRHPKFHPIIMDGKNYALLSDEKYDVIMNDSTFPGKSGSASLYTRDHFMACRERLNEGGVMSSWVPFELWPSDFQNMVKTFQSVFPNTTLCLAGNCRNKHALLLGTVGPFQVDFDRVVELMEMPLVKADLDEIRLGDPYVLMGSLNLDPAMAKRYSEHAPISSDEHPTLEFTAGRHIGTVRSWAINHEDFLRYRASIIPYTRFSKSDPNEAEAARLTLLNVERANIHIDKARLSELTNEAEENFLAFRMITLERRKEYERALELYPDDENIPVFLEEGMATLLALEKMAKNDPENAQVHFELGCAYRGQRRYPEAIAALTRACELVPASERYREMLRTALDESGTAG
jgi:spermidine synthase